MAAGDLDNGAVVAERLVDGRECIRGQIRVVFEVHRQLFGLVAPCVVEGRQTQTSWQSVKL